MICLLTQERDKWWMKLKDEKYNHGASSAMLPIVTP